MSASIFALKWLSPRTKVVGASGVCAAIGWSAWHSVETIQLLALLPGFVLLWARAQSRRVASIYALCYYLAASHCLVEIGKNFWGVDEWSLLRGSAIWFGTSVFLSAIWGSCWGVRWTGLRVIAAIVIITLPPVGIIGWTSPLSAAGVLFPGTKLMGLVLTLGLFSSVCARHRASLYVLVIVSVVANIVVPPTTTPADILAISTRLGNTGISDSEFDRVKYIQRATQRILRNAPDRAIVVFPETLVTSWEVANDYFTQIANEAAAKSVVILIGAQSRRKGGEIINGIFAPGTQDPVATSRIAVPLGFWRPWESESTTIRLWGSETKVLQDKRVGFLICYEQLINWPAIMTLVASPTVLVAPGNVWFGDKSNIEDIKRLNAISWGKLFGVPTVFATNYQR